VTDVSGWPERVVPRPAGPGVRDRCGRGTGRRGPADGGASHAPRRARHAR